MEDLLSVALTEAGLEEFLTPAPSSETSSASEPGTSASLANVDTFLHESNGNTLQEQIDSVPYLEAFSLVASTSTADDVGTTSSQPSVVSQIVRTSSDTVRNLTSTGSVDYRQVNSSSVQGSSQDCGKQNRPLLHATNTSQPTKVYKRVVQTPNGPKTQLLRPFINALGQTVYRPVRVVHASKAVAFRSKSLVVRNVNAPLNTINDLNKANSTSDNLKKQQRVVVIRQITPSGPILVRKSIPADMPLSEVLSTTTNGGLVRRFVTRGWSHEVQPDSSEVISSSRSLSPRSQVRSRRQYFAPVSAVKSPVPKYRSQSMANMRGNKVTEVTRVNAVPPQSLASRLAGIRDYSVAAAHGHVPGNYNNASDHLNVSNSKSLLENSNLSRSSTTPTQSAVEDGRGYRSAKTGYSSRNALQQKLLSQQASSRPNAGAEAAASAGAFEQLDVSRVLPTNSARSTKVPPINPSGAISTASSKFNSKSQKAKDEMRLAHQTAAEKRSEIDEDEENLGYAETYSDYVPAKLRSGAAHPDPVVETASLSSVSPPDVEYQMTIPEYASSSPIFLHRIIDLS